MNSSRRINGQTRRLAWVAWVAGMASYLDAGALVTSGLAIGGFYADSFPLSGAEVGLLLGLQTLAFAAGALVGGRLGDRYGRRRLLVFSIVLYAVGVGALAAAGGLALLTVGVLVSGLAIGADLPTSLAMISEEAPPGSKGRLVALAHLLWVAGIASAGFLGFVLSDLGDIAARIMYLHLLAVAITVLIFRVNLRESDEWSRAHGAERSVPGEGRRPLLSSLRNWVHSSVTPVALAVGLYYALWNLGANTLGQFRAYLWIQVMDGTTKGASLLILIGLPLGLVGAAWFLTVVDTAQRDRWVFLGGLISVAGWLLVTLWPTPATFTCLVVCFVVGASMSGEVMYKVWVQELIPTLLRATVQGATLAAARVLAAVVALFTPALADKDPRLLFGGLLIATAVAVGVSTWWLPKLRSESSGATASR